MPCTWPSPSADFDPDEVEVEDIRSYLKFPKDLDELRTLSFALTEYKDEHFSRIFALFCFAYVYKQTFSIPGSAFLNLLAGHLFGITVAFPLVCLLTGESDGQSGRGDPESDGWCLIG